jgi:hypothetical protein
MKNNRRNKFQTRSYASYDPKMIGDFLEHIKCELQVFLAQHGAKRGADDEAGYMGRPVSTDTVNQLGKYAAKRGCRSLIVEPVIDAKEAGTLSPDDRKRAGELLDAQLAREAKQDLAMLEALEPRLRKALACASRPDQVTRRQLSLLRVLKEYGDDHSGGDPGGYREVRRTD